MLARLFGWTSRSAPEPEAPSAPSTPCSASPPPPAAEPASPTSAAPTEEARLSRNRKKRQQRKAAKARRRSTLGSAGGHHSDDGDSEDDKEPDEDLPAHEEYPEADDDLDYLGRPSDHAAPPPPTAILPPLFPPTIATSSSASISTSTPPVAPEEQNAAALISSMIAQGQYQQGPIGPLQRVYNLPDGAGQLAGVEIKSTAEAKKRAEEAGLVAVTDDKGFLRVGVRINEDLVLLHPKDGKGMPILLKM